MGKTVEKTKKKKGRPSLLDLQKRSLKEQQNQQQNQQQPKKRKLHHRNVSPSISNSTNSTTTPNSSQNHKSATTTTTAPLRRSTRRNPTYEDNYPDSSEDEGNAELNGKRRREKKLKLVLKLPKSDTNSTSINSTGEESNGEDEKHTASNKKKRKINGSESEKGDQKSITGTNPTSDVQDSGPSTPLPDKKLLLFVLDRLQKKDTYGVFSEPVDLNELPDYLEVIEHPMDFGTVRKKLNNGAYGSLKQFEKDVFLICTNAMQYNAPDTIYFRQARSIQELAKKNFENLRQDSDDNNEAEPKTVRRGRPPSENLKKSPARPSLELAGSELPSGATLATGGENRPSEKSGFADSSGQFHGSCSEPYSLTDNRFERNDETAGSMLKGKHSKKHLALDENRRNTYKQAHPSAGGQVPSVLTTFDAERKQLVAVGLLTEHGYVRSIARFAANIGPFAWTIAVKRIERSLAPGVKFGPGWVGENDIPPQRPLFSSPPPSQLAPSLPPQRPFSVLESSTANVTSCNVKSKEEKLSMKHERDIFSQKQVPSTCSSEAHLSPVPPSSSMTTSLSAANKSEPCTERAEAVAKLNSHSAFNVLNSSTGVIRQQPPFQLHQNPAIHPGMIGFNATQSFNLAAAQMGKLIGVGRPAGLSIQSSQMADKVSRTNSNLVHSANANITNSEKTKFPENSSSVNYSGVLPNSGSEAVEAPRSGDQPQPTWQGLYPKAKPDSRSSPHQKSKVGVPPDLNVRYQSPGSPSSGRIDSAHPDLALQL